MSVTITAIPLWLIASQIIGAVAAAKAVTSASTVSSAIKKAFDNAEIEDILNNIEVSQLKNKSIKLEQEDVKLLSKEYETPFMSNELLERTLSEYGLKIEQSSELSIVASIERLIFTFFRKDMNNPYLMKIKFPEDCLEMQSEVASTLFEEYGCNTQEETYIKLKEKIDKSNMYIEDEEILEDDSIVLTINID